jgi:hypothetical protein
VRLELAELVREETPADLLGVGLAGSARSTNRGLSSGREL